MALTMSKRGIEIFKQNISQMLPFQDKHILNLLIKSLYDCSKYNYEVIKRQKGSGFYVKINGLSLSSAFDNERENDLLCSHLKLKKVISDNAGEKFLSSLEKYHKISRKDRQRGNGTYKNRISLYGPGTCEIIPYLQKLKKNPEIDVYILNPGVTALIFCLNPDLGRIFSDPKVHLRQVENEKIADPQFVCIRAELYLQPDSHPLLKQRLQQGIAERFRYIQYYRRFGSMTENLCKLNQPIMAADPQLLESQIEQHDHVVIVGPGNYLSNYLQNLRQLKKEGAFVMASESAMMYLEGVGFAPDVVVSNSCSTFKFVNEQGAHVKPLLMNRPELYKDSKLFYTYKSSSLFRVKFTGEAFLLYNDKLQKYGIEKSEGAFEYREQEIYSSSVLIMLQIALKAKPSNISLFGIDAVSRNLSYHAGLNESADKAWAYYNTSTLGVTCNEGKIRNALHTYETIKLFIEEIIEDNPDITFVNYSLAGSLIKGAVYALIDELIGIDESLSYITEGE